MKVHLTTELLVPFDSDIRRVKRIVLDNEAEDTLGMIPAVVLLRVFVLIEHTLVPIYFWLLSLNKVKICQILILIILYFIINISHWCVLLYLFRAHLAYLPLSNTVLIMDLLLIRMFFETLITAPSGHGR